MTFTTLSIKVSAADKEMLERIAKSQDRRFNDLVQILFANGLEYSYVDETVSVKKEDSEFTEQELGQKLVNDDLITNGYYQLSQADRKATDFKHVDSHFHNGFCCNDEDTLIAPIAERIKAFAVADWSPAMPNRKPGLISRVF